MATRFNDVDERVSSLIAMFHPMAVSMANLGLYYDTTRHTITCSSCTFMFDRTVMLSPKETHRKLSPNCVFSKQPMDYESKRMLTFHNWPKSDIVPIELFQQSGFFYTGISDIVKCAFCNGRLENWVVRDNPILQHIQHFSTCPYIRGHDTQNVNDTHNTTQNASQGAAVQGAKQEDLLCKICLENRVNVCVVPCGHISTCDDCISYIQFCIICRGRIQHTQRIFIS